MSFTRDSKSPEKNLANLESIFCLVLMRRSSAEGARRSILGSNARVISAPFLVIGSCDCPA